MLLQTLNYKYSKSTPQVLCNIFIKFYFNKNILIFYILRARTKNSGVLYPGTVHIYNIIYIYIIIYTVPGTVSYSSATVCSMIKQISDMIISNKIDIP